MSAPIQSAIDPAGPQAAHIYALDRAFLIVCSIVFVLVIGTLFAAVLRRRSASGPVLSVDEQGDRRLIRAVAVATFATTAILLGLIGASVATGKSLNYGATPEALSVSVRGHMWWWEIKYLDPVPSNIVTDANELHIPVGRPVRLELGSSDVIHSLWIPNLHGKTDLIPGHTNVTVLQADKPGEYRAQCAEYCGAEHAKMALIVVAHPQGEFDAWLANARKIPPPPTEPAAQRGQQVFLRATCPMCHTIAGTPAAAILGPDLTHVGSRKTLASGTITNAPGNLAGWIVDPHGIKPGVNMPSNVLPGDDLNALVAYLGGLR